MRPSCGLFIILFIFLVLSGALYSAIRQERRGQDDNFRILQQVVFSLAISDLALSTEARYTRHPAVSDAVVVSMDHPGAIDHFPSTLFWAPVR